MLGRRIEELRQTQAKFDKLQGAKKLLDAARGVLGKLADLGDLVTAGDVVKAGGELAAAGLSPMALAKLMSDMPESGPELAGWLARHEEQLGQREAELEPVLGAVQHQMGVSALQVLAAMPQRGPEGNALTSPAGASAGAPALLPEGGENAPS